MVSYLERGQLTWQKGWGCPGGWSSRLDRVGVSRMGHVSCQGSNSSGGRREEVRNRALSRSLTALQGHSSHPGAVEWEWRVRPYAR